MAKVGRISEKTTFNEISSQVKYPPKTQFNYYLATTWLLLGGRNCSPLRGSYLPLARTLYEHHRRRFPLVLLSRFAGENAGEDRRIPEPPHRHVAQSAFSLRIELRLLARSWLRFRPNESHGHHKS